MESSIVTVKYSPEETTARTTRNQFTALLEFMERHGDLSKTPHGATELYKHECLWEELAMNLNTLSGGVQKPPVKWKKVWTDWKVNTKKKLARIRRRRLSGEVDGPTNRSLTGLEARVLKLIGAVQDLLELEGLIDPEEQISLSPVTTPTQQNDCFFDAVFIEDGSEPMPSPSPLPLEVMNTESTAAPFNLLNVNQRQPLTRRLPAVSSTGSQSPASSQVPLKARSPHSTVSSNRRLQRARRRELNPFDRAANAFIAIEERRLRLDEMREKNEAKRIEVDRERNTLLSRFADIAELWLGQHLQNRME